MGDINFPSTHPKARRRQLCDQCGRWIEPGETYRRQGYVYDGEIDTTTVCTQCEAFAEALYAAGFEGNTGGWPYIPELDAAEVAHVGLSREFQLFRDRWHALVPYPTDREEDR